MSDKKDKVCPLLLEDLPRGQSDSYGEYWGYYGQWEPYKKPKLKCTCGSWTTWGKGVEGEWHADYCDLVRKKL